MSHVNVLERQKGRKEIGRINHSEKLTSRAHQSSEIQWAAENQRNEAYLPSERMDRIQSRVPVFAKKGLCPQKCLLSTTTVSTRYMTWKHVLPRGTKVRQTVYTYCKEIKKTSTCSLHTLNSKGLRGPTSVLYISNTWDFIYCRDERSTRWNLSMFRWRGHSLRKNKRNRVIPTAHLFTRTMKGKMQSFAYITVTEDQEGP